LWHSIRVGQSSPSLWSARGHAAANKSLQANKLITAFFEVSCKSMWVPMMEVTGQVTVCHLSSALASIGWSDVQIGLADGLLVGFGVMYGNEFRK